MKRLILLMSVFLLGVVSCKKNETAPDSHDGHETTATSSETAAAQSQDGIVDDESNPDIVKLAVGNKDLTTLVKAVDAAGLTTSLSNAGPFTVFAPVNGAFDKLPAGTLDDLMKPENSNKLNDILGHHTYVGVIKADQFTDGQTLGMVDGKSITIKMVDGKPTVNGTANIVASVDASNGVVHVVDTVILPE